MSKVILEKKQNKPSYNKNYQFEKEKSHMYMTF